MPSGPGRGHRRARARGRGRARRARPRRRPRGPRSTRAGPSSSSSSRGSSPAAGSPGVRRPSTRRGCPSSQALVTGRGELPRPLVVGGRSAGARVACRTAEELEADAALLLSFPLHPPGQPEKLRAHELALAPTRRGWCRARTTASAPRPSSRHTCPRGRRCSRCRARTPSLAGSASGSRRGADPSGGNAPRVGVVASHMATCPPSARRARQLAAAHRPLGRQR